MTPMMKQYYEIKERTPDCILFFRLGDFYEMFGDDAKVAAHELDITLTTRDKREDVEERMPMCGVPYHSAEPYIARLIAKGYKVAICEQMSDPATTKGIVDRDVVRIVTPGTLIDTSMLDAGKPNYLCAVYFGKDNSAAVCFADLSTGEVSVSEFDNNDIGLIINEIGTYSPSEIILGGCYERSTKIKDYFSTQLNCLTQYDNERYNEANVEKFNDHFRGSEHSSPANSEVKPLALSASLAAGALFSYIVETQKTDVSHMQAPNQNTGETYMTLDINTLRNLELIATIRTGDKKGSLLWILDKTKTPMGRRMIRSWVLRPLLKPVQIKRRQGAVSELVNNTMIRNELIHSLREIGDMERLIGKVVYGNAGGQDLKALSKSILVLPEIKNQLKSVNSTALKTCAEMDLLAEIADSIENAIIDEPPMSVREAGFIKPGFNEEVDRLKNLLENSHTALLDIEIKEKERTGKKLKVRYNKVFGYYIEIPRSSSDDVPDDYIRKQTLVDRERFITQELKELETELLSAKDKLADLEYRLFEELRKYVAGEVARVQHTSRAIAELDAYCSIAEVAVKNNYTQPEVDISGVIDIRDGRHPVVEIMQQDSLFVPNDTFLDINSSRTAIITGPNMAGKSTYMRQTALIVLMAQMGSFVPAKSASVGVVDRVFTRIGASDDLSAGKSTFMVEMTEVADILKDATKTSLLILDEIGRGTSTYDGMSVARAVLEFCNDKRKLGAKTMFATHYHELTVLEDEIEGIKNYNISAKKRGDDIIFLRKIVNGGADDSYGIEVAGLAGLPDSVIKRAKAVLKTLEEAAQGEGSGVVVSQKASKQKRNHLNNNGFDVESNQISLMDMSANEIASMLNSTDLNTLTPLEALNLLYEMKKKL